MRERLHAYLLSRLATRFLQREQRLQRLRDEEAPVRHGGVGFPLSEWFMLQPKVQDLVSDLIDERWSGLQVRKVLALGGVHPIALHFFFLLSNRTTNWRRKLQHS